MTKREFFLRTMIALASNPKYVINGELDVNVIIDDAKLLAHKACKQDGVELDGYDTPMFEEPNERVAQLVSEVRKGIYEVKEMLDERQR